MSFSETEARIRRLMARIGDAERRTDSVQDKILRTRQDLAGFYQVGAEPCVTTLQGSIVGGLSSPSVPIPGSTLQVVGHVSGIDYGTHSVPTGTYDLQIFDVDPTDTSLDLYPFGPSSSPRFNGASPFANIQAITRCSVNAIGDIIPPAAPGYGWLLQSIAGSFACQFPVGELSWVDSLIGAWVAPASFGPGGFFGAQAWISSCFLGNSYASGPCPATSGVPIHATMQASGTAGFFYKAAFLGSNCPAIGTCGDTRSASVGYGPSAITSKTCPAIDLSTKFEAIWTVNDQMWHNSAAHTLRFYEA